MGEMVTYPQPDGRSAPAYLAAPREPAAPGVVVIQEWWGLQAQVKAVCDRLAGAGFRALAPDLYGGKVVPYHDRAGAEAAMAALDLRAATELAVRGAVQHLGSAGGKVGLAGFCMGGAVTVVGAARIPELSAAVVFYGLPPPEIASGRDVRVPLQAHFAAIDDWCTRERVDAFEAQLGSTGLPCEIHRYQARHAFMNEERPEAHDPAAARLAWDRCLTFLRRHLG